MNKIASALMAAVLFVFSAGTILAQTANKTSSGSTNAVAGDLEKVSDDGKSITV